MQLIKLVKFKLPSWFFFLQKNPIGKQQKIRRNAKIFTVKQRLSIFPSPAAWMSLTKLSLAGARNYRPCFRENQPKRSFSIK
jgi:hypothetical protein